MLQQIISRRAGSALNTRLSIGGVGREGGMTSVIRESATRTLCSLHRCSGIKFAFGCFINSIAYFLPICFFLTEGIFLNIYMLEDAVINYASVAWNLPGI